MYRGNERINVAAEQAKRAGTTADDYRLTVLRKQVSALTEKIEVLNGERKRALAKSAVLRGEVSAPTLKSKKVSSSPTAEDFNALVSDIQALTVAIGKLTAR